MLSFPKIGLDLHHLVGLADRPGPEQCAERDREIFLAFAEHEDRCIALGELVDHLRGAPERRLHEQPLAPERLDPALVGSNGFDAHLPHAVGIDPAAESQEKPRLFHIDGPAVDVLAGARLVAQGERPAVADHALHLGRMRAQGGHVDGEQAITRVVELAPPDVEHPLEVVAAFGGHLRRLFDIADRDPE